MDRNRDHPKRTPRDESAFDLDALLHPARAFAHPDDVVGNPDLTLNEKRAILASWASDACALEAMPTWRLQPHGRKPVEFDDIMQALQELDRQAAQSGMPKRRLWRRGWRGTSSSSSGHGDIGFYG